MPVETLIIDAYNLMHRVGDLRFLLSQPQDVCSDSLCAKLTGYFHGKKVKCIIIFDGFGMNKHEGNISVKYSKTATGTDYGSADKLIKHLIENAKNPKLLRVISSDREITLFARSCGAKVQASESFWGEVRENRAESASRKEDMNEKPEIITKGEFEFFLKKFTGEKNK